MGFRLLGKTKSRQRRSFLGQDAVGSSLTTGAHMKRILFWWSVIAIFLCSPAVVSEVHPDQDQSANDLVRQMVSNELKALDQDHTSWIYRLETEKGGTREVLEV